MHAMLRILCTAAAVLCCAGVASAGKPGESLGRKLTTQARMEWENLKAARADVEKHHAARVDVPSRTPTLTDYRGIMHSHAEDSAHTGGTRPEMLEDAKKAGVQIIFLSNHLRPPRDFMTDSWRGLRDGVLFIPGSETSDSGLLMHPMESVMDVMKADLTTIIERCTDGDGMIFLSHIEDRFDHPLDGFTGMEIYNRHADAKDDMTVLFSLVQDITHPEKAADMMARIAEYPKEMLAMQLDYPELYMEKWDESSQKQRVVGIAANDCHHNQVFISKMIDEKSVRVGTNVDDDEDMRVFDTSQFPGIAEMTKGHEPGDILASFDFDPYYVSFENCSTHILAEALTEEAARKAVLAGHVYVAHDWMCDPTGFQYVAYDGEPSAEETVVAMQGDEVHHADGLTLYAEFPVACHIRLLRDGEVIVDTNDRTLTHEADTPGVYRVEGWLEVNTEDRVWIYSNPIYVR